jgi:hypothetical protein
MRHDVLSIRGAHHVRGAAFERGAANAGPGCAQSAAGEPRGAFNSGQQAFAAMTKAWAWRGVEAEADHVKVPRCVTRRTHARFKDLIVHFKMDWRRVGQSAVVLMVPVLPAPGLAALASGHCAQLCLVLP